MPETEQHSLTELHKSLVGTLRNISSPLPLKNFQEIHKSFLHLSDLISKAHVFSANESIDELPTSSIPLMLVPWEHAQFIDFNAVRSQLGPDAPSTKRNRLRLMVLKIVESLLWEFLVTTKNYDIMKRVEEPSKSGIVKWLQVYGELKSENDGDVKLNDIDRLVYSGKGAVGKRDSKMEKWKLEKDLKEKVKLLDDFNDSANNLDDDIVRNLRVDQVCLGAISAIGCLEGILTEKEMLAEIVNGGFEKLQELNPDDATESDNGIDRRERKRQIGNFDKGYTDKLENLDSKLLSKEGKVLRPFTIVGSNDKKRELKSKVFGTGQVLPTMTVEELVDQELKNGGMVKPKEEETEPDEDEISWQDKETYRLREWDEFTDTHKKGSGNKMGNLG